MTFKFTSCDDGSGCSVGSVVTLESVTILIDPAWDGRRVSYRAAVEYWARVIKDIDVVILSHPTVECLGAFTLLYCNFLAHFVSRIEVYATLPVANLGRIATIDHYVALGVLGPAAATNELELSDVEASFDAIRTLKYSQIVDLKYKFDGLSLIAYCSGASPGGSIWYISTYVDKIVYMKRWNHTRGLLLDAAHLVDSNGKPLSTLIRSSALITTFDKFGPTKPFKRRNREFKELLRNYIRDKKTILIPVDISTNFLDHFVAVHDFIHSKTGQSHHHHSHHQRSTNVPILLVSYSRGRSLTYAKSMLEWFTSTLLRTWESKDNTSPFSIGNNRFHIIKPEEIKNYPGPKICFISDVDPLLNEVISRVYETENLQIVLTQIRSNNNSNSDDDSTDLMSELYNKWIESITLNSKLMEGDNITFSETINLTTWKREYLKDKELEEFTKKIEERRTKRKNEEEILRNEAKNATKNTDLFASNAKIANGLNDKGRNEGIEDDEEEEDEDDDDDKDILKIRSKINGTAQRQPIPVDIEISKTTKHKMFPFNPIREKNDDYGKVVDFAMFIPHEEMANEGTNPHVENESRSREKRGHGEVVNDGGDDHDNENDDDEEDEYIIGEIPTKKPRRGRRRGRGKGNRDKDHVEENFDNISHLEVLSHPFKRILVEKPIKLNINMTFVNLSDLVDQRSTTVILPTLKPRKLLLLAPPSAQNDNVVDSLSRKKIDVAKTQPNTELQLDTAVKNIDISIDVELDQQLNWQKIGDNHTVAHVVGRLVKEQRPFPSAAAAANANANGNAIANTRSKLVLKPLGTSSRYQSSGTLSIGDVRLTDLKRKLTDLRHVAEFKGEGTLVVDGQVAVMKISDSETVVDGTPSDVFDTVKGLITDMLAKI